MGTHPDAVMDEEKPHGSKPKGRRRRKQLYQNLRQQMEFYFSDANLAKDRFLRQLVEDDPFVPLQTFLTFNKINQMVTSVEEIAKALRDSSVLELSDDGSKVCRKTPFAYKDNEDDCTIYVENLAPETTHESLTKVFSEFGKVVYVSIPKFRNNQSIKGFAFIEFDSPEDAAKTIEVFREKGSCLSAQMLPEKLCSIQTFEDHNPHMVKSQEGKTVKDENKTKTDSEIQPECKQESVIKSEPESASESENIISDQKNHKKRKNELETNEECSLNENEHKHKKRKSSEVEVGIKADATEGVVHAEQEIKQRKRSKSGTENENGSDSIEVTSDQEQKKKKKKREELEEEAISSKQGESESKTKKKKEAKRQRLMSEGEVSESDDDELNPPEGGKKKNRKKKKKLKEETDVFALGIHVLPKKEWKRLRNKYLNMQRVHMKRVKHQLAEARFMKRSWGNPHHQVQPHVEPHTGHTEDTPSLTTAAEQSKPRVTFTPGVIVQVKFNEPVVDIKTFKAEARSQPSVQYVDIHEGACNAYLRCSSASDAQNLLQAKCWDQMTLVQGEEENGYWEKIFKDREDKIGKKMRTNKERGRKKLIRKAEAVQATHLHFDS